MKGERLTVREAARRFNMPLVSVLILRLVFPPLFEKRP